MTCMATQFSFSLTSRLLNQHFSVSYVTKLFSDLIDINILSYQLNHIFSLSKFKDVIGIQTVIVVDRRSKES